MGPKSKNVPDTLSHKINRNITVKVVTTSFIDYFNLLFLSLEILSEVSLSMKYRTIRAKAIGQSAF